MGHVIIIFVGIVRVRVFRTGGLINRQGALDVEELGRDPYDPLFTEVCGSSGFVHLMDGLAFDFDSNLIPGCATAVKILEARSLGCVLGRSICDSTSKRPRHRSIHACVLLVACARERWSQSLRTPFYPWNCGSPNKRTVNGVSRDSVSDLSGFIKTS